MPKSKLKTTVNVDAVKRQVSKMVKESEANPQTPPSRPTVQRESPVEQEMGTSKYRQMIHGHNEKNKHVLDRLPFTFPRKKAVRSHLNLLIQCANCGWEMWGSENTVGLVCPQCKQYSKAVNPEAEERGYDPDLAVGFGGNATDRLAEKEKIRQKKGQ